jgi:hypothetical protein
VSVEPCVWTTFCDDLRQEAGNKLSYMGVYGPNLIVPAYPTTVPRLCCVFSLRLPATANPRRITFKLLRDDVEISVADMLATGGRRLIPELPTDSARAQVVTISSAMQISNLEIAQRALLTARAYVDGKELHGGQLELLAAQGKPSTIAGIS